MHNEPSVFLRHEGFGYFLSSEEGDCDPKRLLGRINHTAIFWKCVMGADCKDHVRDQIN